jgi:hypothetical protein
MRFAGLLFGTLTVAFAAGVVVVDAIWPEWGEGLGILLWLLTLLTGPLALLFGLLTVRRGYPTAGYVAIALGGAPLLLWWLDSLR